MFQSGERRAINVESDSAAIEQSTPSDTVAQAVPVRLDEVVHGALQRSRSSGALRQDDPVDLLLMPHIFVDGELDDYIEALADLIARAAPTIAPPLSIRTRLDSSDIAIVIHDDLSNEPDQFILRLPIAVTPRLTERRAQQRRSEQRRRRRRILIVDDNIDVAHAMAAALELTGYATHIAIAGQDAVSCVKRFQPDVVLLDINLPDIDGIEVAERISASLSLSAAPLLIALTGYGDDDIRQRTEQAGFDRLYTKPADLRAIVEYIESAALSLPNV